MQLLLCEDGSRLDLLPFTFTRPLWALRCGIATLAEKWHHFLPSPPAHLSQAYLGARFNSFLPDQESLFINGKFVPDAAFVKDILAAAEPGALLVNEKGEWVAGRSTLTTALIETLRSGAQPEGLRTISFPTGERIAIRALADLFLHNAACIRQDFAWMASSPSAKINDPHTRVYGADNIWIGGNVKLRAAILNAEDGPIYLGPGSEVQEGAIIHGTHAFCEHSVVNMGAKMRGDSTVGPHSKVGGEIANSVIMGFSNKGHDGYLGNSVIGYWCNLGADTNTSNLKNNYAPVKLWSYRKRGFAPTGQTFCGLMMGDHSKCGINTMFNTGTVVGVSANIFGDGFPRNFIPSFSWGGAAGFVTYKLKDALDVARIVMARRKVQLDDNEIQILTEAFGFDAEFRTWEKS